MPPQQGGWAAVRRRIRRLKDQGFSDEEIQLLAQSTTNQKQYKRLKQQILADKQVTTPGPPPPPLPPPAGPTEAMTDARDYIDGILSEYGIGGLSDWAWEQIVDGASIDRIIQSLRQQPLYQQRFGGMLLRQEQGLPAISESEYIAFERQAFQLMRSYGLPEGFYDQPEDFVAMIGNDLSLNELNQRISNGFARVTQNAPPEVLDAFARMYGTNGVAELAALYLDPDRQMPRLLEQAQSAEFAGYGDLYGFDASRDEAERVGRLGLSTQEIRRGVDTLAEANPFFEETVSEDTDLRAESEGADYVFAGGPGSDAVRRRIDERRAAFGGTVNPQTDNQGLASARSAGR